jgi:hypothetical protein
MGSGDRKGGVIEELGDVFDRRTPVAKKLGGGALAGPLPAEEA